MKKITALFLTALLTTGIYGCSSASDKKTNTSSVKETTEEASMQDTEKHNNDDGSSYGIDLTSESIQVMGEDKISQETMKSFVDDVFGDNFKLPPSDKAASYTYGDCKDMLGADANMYTAETDDNERDYIWMSSESDTTRLMLVFADTDGDGTYTLSSYGAPNLK